MGSSWILFFAGVALVMGSLATHWVLPEEAVWTDDHAVKFSQVRAELHSLAHQTMHVRAAADKAQLEQQIAAKQIVADQLGSDLEQARDRSFWLRWSLRVVGGVLMLCGTLWEKRER